MPQLPAVRERVLAAPLLFLKARHALGPIPEDEARLLMDDFDMLAAVARRTRRRLREGVFRRLLPPERQEVHRLGAAAHDELSRLAERLREEERPMLAQGTRQAMRIVDIKAVWRRSPRRWAPDIAT